MSQTNLRENNSEVYPSTSLDILEQSKALQALDTQKMETICGNAATATSSAVHASLPTTSCSLLAEGTRTHATARRRPTIDESRMRELYLSRNKLGRVVAKT